MVVFILMLVYGVVLMRGISPAQGIGVYRPCGLVPLDIFRA